MKLKYLFPSLIAAIAMLVSCSDEFEPTYLDEIKVSQSYVALPAGGGNVVVDVEAVSEWTVADAPEWLKLSAASGAAGKTSVTFSADAAEATREATVKLNCAGQTQLINVVQMTEKADLPISTCAEVLAGPDSKTFRVKGVCTKIANTKYGNWYIDDGTGEVYIYGTLDAKGQTENFLSWGLEVGDEVTVEGPKTTYGGVVELVNVTVINIEKSLIKVDSLDIEDSLPIEGGDFTVNLTCKGNGVSVVLPEDAKSWLSVTSVITSGTTATVTFNAAANDGGDRSTTLVFKTTDGKKEYSSETTISQKGAIIEVSIADFLSAEPSNTLYRITGIITQVANASYGNVYIKDFSGEVYVYGIGAKGDFEALGLKEGDVVTLVGKRGEYNGTAQMASASYESSYSVTEVTIEEFLSKEDNPNVYYRVTGIVTEIANATYGNLYLSDGTNSLYVYGCYPGWGATGDARKDCLANQGIEVGDLLTVTGPKSTYNGTPQVNGGIYISHQKPEPTE